MSTKTVLWTGHQRIIPGIGVGASGNILIMPVRLADSYIKQGLCKEYVEEVKPNKRTKVEEGK